MTCEVLISAYEFLMFFMVCRRSGLLKYNPKPFYHVWTVQLNLSNIHCFEPPRLLKLRLKLNVYDFWCGPGKRVSL